MSVVKELYQMTVQLKSLLEQPISAKNRQTVIGQLTNLIEQRGEHMKHMTPPFTDEEKKLGKEMVQLNAKIEQRMQSLFDELKLEMKQVKQQKKSNLSYINPYKNVQTMDGLYLDRKN